MSSNNDTIFNLAFRSATTAEQMLPLVLPPSMVALATSTNSAYELPTIPEVCMDGTGVCDTMNVCICPLSDDYYYNYDMTPAPNSTPQMQPVNSIPTTFTIGRNLTVRQTADYQEYIDAIEGTLIPCDGSTLLLTTDSRTGIPGIVQAVSASAGRPLRSGIINGLLVGVFGYTSSQQNFCPRPDRHDNKRVKCTRANCSGHYDGVVGNRDRFTAVEDVAYR